MVRYRTRSGTPIIAIYALVFATVAVLALILAVIVNIAKPITEGLNPPTPQQVPTSAAAPAPVPSVQTHPPRYKKHTVVPLPVGVVAQVAPPEGGTGNGFTAGNLDYSIYAPAYTVKVPTATVTKHWGFTYNYQCDQPVDDDWRHLHPHEGAFSVRLGNDFLLIGPSYNKSGYISVESPAGGAAHILKVSGPCSYQFNYYIFN